MLSHRQRLFAIIEIGNTPFPTGQGPTDFGISNSVSNIYIHDGIIGLSSQSGIHSNNASNVTLENLTIYGFEAAGIDLKGLNKLSMTNLIIGPSSVQVQS